MAIGLFVLLLLGIVGVLALFVTLWLGVAILVVAFVAFVTAVFWVGARADSLPGEEPPEMMAHLRGPGI
jgi:hypothetical protein